MPSPDFRAFALMVLYIWAKGRLKCQRQKEYQ
nr:MAG TPA: hypothetical protein [Caudoviricetes sp.]